MRVLTLRATHCPQAASWPVRSLLWQALRTSQARPGASALRGPSKLPSSPALAMLVRAGPGGCWPRADGPPRAAEAAFLTSPQCCRRSPGEGRRAGGVGEQVQLRPAAGTSPLKRLHGSHQAAPGAGPVLGSPNALTATRAPEDVAEGQGTSGGTCTRQAPDWAEKRGQTHTIHTRSQQLFYVHVPACSHTSYLTAASAHGRTQNTLCVSLTTQTRGQKGSVQGRLRLGLAERSPVLCSAVLTWLWQCGLPALAALVLKQQLQLLQRQAYPQLLLGHQVQDLLQLVGEVLHSVQVQHLGPGTALKGFVEHAFASVFVP